MTTIEQQLARLGMKPIFGRYLPLSPAEIARVERSVGSELPSDYRAFVSKFGCAHFPDREVDVRPTSSPPPEVADTGLLEISALFGGGNKGHQVLLNLELLRGRMPASMVPIADDLSGNVFCLDTRKGDEGTIYFWSSVHELSREDFISQGMEVPKDLLFRNLTRVANSFSDFVMRLQKRDDSMP